MLIIRPFGGIFFEVLDVLLGLWMGEVFGVDQIDVLEMGVRVCVVIGRMGGNCVAFVVSFLRHFRAELALIHATTHIIPHKPLQQILLLFLLQLLIQRHLQIRNLLIRLSRS